VIVDNVQAQRHAPGLKVIVYDGVARKAQNDDDRPTEVGKKTKKPKSFKKMSREEKFKTSAVRSACIEACQFCALLVATPQCHGEY